MPRELRLTLEGINKSCTDLSGGLLEPENYSPSRAWELAFYEFSTPGAAEDIQTFQNLIVQSLMGAGIKHRLNCKEGGKTIFEVDFLKVAPEFLRNVIGQNDKPTPTENLVGGSDTFSVRFDARTSHDLPKGEFGYGFNFMHLPSGKETKAQTTYSWSRFLEAYAGRGHSPACFC